MLGLGLGSNKGTVPIYNPFAEFNYSAEVISSEDGWSLYDVEGENSTLSYNQTIESLADDPDGWMQFYVGETQETVVGLEYALPDVLPIGVTSTVSLDIAFIPEDGWDPQNQTDTVGFYTRVANKQTFTTASPGVINSFEIDIVKTTVTTSNVRIYVSVLDDLPNAGSSMLIKNINISFR